MRSQVAKRTNINLTKEEIKALEKLSNMERFKGWTNSDLIRQAIKVYAREMGKLNFSSGYKTQERAKNNDDDELPF